MLFSVLRPALKYKKGWNTVLSTVNCGGYALIGESDSKQTVEEYTRWAVTSAIQNTEI